MWVEKIKKIHVFLFSLTCYYLIHRLTDLFPVNGGAGFDGSVYLEYILKIAAGVDIHNDPYRLMRVSGFIPAIFMAYLGLGVRELILFQAILNSVMLAMGAAIFFSTCQQLTGKKTESLIATGTLFFSWPYLVMPIYYPILSDHIALLASILALWAWARSSWVLLCVIIFFSVWLMPGLFIVPLLLLAFPREGGDFNMGQVSRNSVIRSVLFCIFLSASGYSIYRLNGLSNSEINMHPPGFDIGMDDLKAWSIVLVGVLMACTAFSWSWIFSRKEFWKLISVKQLMLGLCIVALGIISINAIIDWSSGNQGPPLFYFLLLQASAAPLKPIVAHFLYYGPIFIMALCFCLFLNYKIKSRAEFSLLVAISAYLPLLIFGSESRQWIAIFPVAITFLILVEKRVRVLLLLLAGALLLCSPAIFLKSEINAAVLSGSNYLSNEWQLYFGRQGPWMSPRIYIIGLISMLTFFVSYVAVSRDKT
ncbi:hypothetical protein [Delftia sp. RIT313]|uniref:hypothetical protein n=1 Tax=Delftia sp. RIT313 TaxID=1468410 RepID=UPI00044BB4A0|nr:hypothetical protein [Delftia sp. RIT313]EZP54000.1 hypothetical protein BW39_02669 [Delftia sp. RIT313]